MGGGVFGSSLTNLNAILMGPASFDFALDSL